MSISVKTYRNPYLSSDSDSLNSLQHIGIDYSVANIDNSGGILGGVNDFMSFLRSVGEKGLFETVYGKSFPVVVGDFIVNILKEAGIFILRTGDLLFLIPSIILMFATFVIGRNKYTKWIIPLWVAYFITVFFYKFVTNE